PAPLEPALPLQLQQPPPQLLMLPTVSAATLAVLLRPLHAPACRNPPFYASSSRPSWLTRRRTETQGRADKLGLLGAENLVCQEAFSRCALAHKSGRFSGCSAHNKSADLEYELFKETGGQVPELSQPGRLSGVEEKKEEKKKKKLILLSSFIIACTHH